MATGRLGAVDLTAAATDTLLYTAPAGFFTVASVSITNRSNTSSTIRLGLAASSTSIASGEFLEYEVELLPHGVLERTGIVLQAGYSLLFRGSIIGINAVAYGIETSTT
jgi:uncharacterized membrane protein SpoIIM required for sporulation